MKFKLLWERDLVLLRLLLIHLHCFSSALSQNPTLVSKFPKVTLKAPFEDTLQSLESGKSGSNQSVVFNKTLVRLELQCTYHKPISWEFKFDPYVYHWTDAFWTRSHRNFERFTESSSYSYTSILKIRFHDPIPIPQVFSCYELLSNDFRGIQSIKPNSTKITSVFLHNDDDNTFNQSTVKFHIQSPDLINSTVIEGNIESTDPIDYHPEDSCKVTFWIKKLAVGKLQWKCVTEEDNASPKISYRHNWYCTTAEQCRNYYARAKNRKTCIKQLSSSDECPGCITYSGLASFLLFCKTDDNTDHWMIPISYTMNTELTLPTQNEGWNFTIRDYENMVYFKPIPSNLIIGDEILLECHASEFIFSTSVIFALKYSSSSTLEYLEDNSNFTFKYSPQSQTYTSYYEDDTGNSSFYNIPTNTRIYRRVLKLEEKHWKWNGGLEEVFCYAPIWNGDKWVSKSQRVVKLPLSNEQHADGRYLRLGIDNPKVVILPIFPTGYFSREDILVIKDSTENPNWAVKLNCSYHQPIQWKILQKDMKDKLNLTQELRRKVPRNEPGLENSIFMLSLTLTGNFRAQESFSVTCLSTSNPLSNSRITFNGSIHDQSIRTETLSALRVSPFPSIDEGRLMNRKMRKNNNCLTVFIVKEIDPSTGQLAWKCVDGLQPSEQMNDVSEIECDDYISCNLQTQDGIIQDPTRCLKVLNPNEVCDNCDSRLLETKTRHDFTRYLRCEGQQGITYQPIYKPLNSSVPVIWYQLSSYEEMLKLEEVPGGILYLNQNYTIKCAASPHIFSRGLRISLQYENQTINTVFLAGREDYDNTTNRIVISIEIEITNLYMRGVTCYAPMAFSSEWINTTNSFIVVDSYPPVIHDNDEDEIKVSGVVGDVNATLTCEADGVPAPKLHWTFPSEVANSQIALKSIVIESTRINLTTLSFNPVLEIHLGIYECVASSVVGTLRKRYYFQPQLAGVQNGDHNNWVVIGLVSLTVLLTLIALYIYWKCWRLKKTVEVLTQEEIDEFFKGVQEVKCDLEIPNQEVYCQPFNGALEIHRSNIKFDKSIIIGEGAFGVVCLGYLTKDPTTEIAVKLVKPTAKLEVFKTLLAEIKVMSYVGEHENLVKFLGACTSSIQKKEVVVVMEFCVNGSLKNYLCTNRNSFEVALGYKQARADSCIETEEYENTKNTALNVYTITSNNGKLEYANTSTVSHNLSQLLKWSAEIAGGCEYLESKRVVHGDIAARNVLLCQNLTAKLSDFGLSRVISEYSNYAKSPANCPLPWKWLSPECLTDMKFSSKSDVWAYGITLWEIFSLGEMPYPGMSYTTEFVQLLQTGLRPVKPRVATEKIFKCMEECWAQDAKDRPLFSAIIKTF